MDSDDFDRWMCYLLFPGKDVLIEEELYLLVGDVDAQLLEWIASEILKAEDVQHAYGQRFPTVNYQDFIN